MLPGEVELLNDCTSCERMAKAEEAIQNLKGDMSDMDKKLDRFQYWFLGLLGTSLLTLVAVMVEGAN